MKLTATSAFRLGRRCSLSTLSPYQQQGHAGSKTLHQQHPPVLNRRCRLTQVDMYNGCKTCWLLVLVDTACIICRVSSIYETVKQPSVLSALPSRHSAAVCHCCRFAAVGPAGRRYRSIAARRALSSKCEQCHVAS